MSNSDVVSSWPEAQLVGGWEAGHGPALSEWYEPHSM